MLSMCSRFAGGYRRMNISSVRSHSQHPDLLVPHGIVGKRKWAGERKHKWLCQMLMRTKHRETIPKAFTVHLSLALFFNVLVSEEERLLWSPLYCWHSPSRETASWIEAYTVAHACVSCWLLITLRENPAVLKSENFHWRLTNYLSTKTQDYRDKKYYIKNPSLLKIYLNKILNIFFKLK